MHLCLITSLQKTDGSWRMTVDSRRLNQVVAPVAAGVPDMVSLLGQIHQTLGIWHATTDSANLFFSIPVRKEDEKQVHIHMNNNIQLSTYSMEFLSRYLHLDNKLANKFMSGLIMVDQMPW